MIGGSQDGIIDRRIYLGQLRKDIQTDFVAHHIVYKVRAVGHKRHRTAAEILLNFLTCNTEQRTDYIAFSWTDSHQTIKPRATDKIDENRLYRIFLMMSYTDSICRQCLFQLEEIAVTQTACSHLYAHLVLCRIGLCIEVCLMKWDVLTYT